jgi:2-polyprenyl-3-methyl-5-hydroxy-6-metoxy-1,4-benzoquinol methylase
LNSNTTYEDKLAQEAETWGSEAERMAELIPPEWRYHRTLRHNVIVHGKHINELLKLIQPEMKTLELGCSSGWLTLALAQQGANATGMDVSEKSLNVGRAYYDKIRETVLGTVMYSVIDINHLALPSETYDVIVIKGVLHHLVNIERVIHEVHKSLKSGGLLWVDDTNGEEALSSVLLAGIFAFLLATPTSYADKFRALFKFGFRTPSRVQASIEAHGLSPFEGAGREHNWLKLIYENFNVKRSDNLVTFTGYVSAQWLAPDRVAIPILKIMRAIDYLLTRLKLLRNTGFVLYAYKISEDDGAA